VQTDHLRVQPVAAFPTDLPAPSIRYKDLAEFKKETAALIKNVTKDTDTVLAVFSNTAYLLHAWQAGQLARAGVDAGYEAKQPDSLSSDEQKLESQLAGHLVSNVLQNLLTALLSRTYSSRDTRQPAAVNALLAQALDACAALLKVPSTPDPTVSAVGDVLMAVFQDTRPFYVHHGQDEPAAAALAAAAAEEDDSWRSKAVFGSWVDVFDNAKWRPAHIVEESENRFRVSFDGGESATHNERSGEWIDKDSWRIAKVHSKSLPYIEQWRLDLQKGSKCDAIDTVSKWYTVNILDAKEFIVKINYDGWSSTYDEWVSRTSDRLQALKTMAKGGKESGGVVMHSKGRVIDDQADPEDALAVYRGKEWGSYCLTQMVNHFATSGGFDAICARLEPRGADAVPVVTLRKLLAATGHVANLYSRVYARSLLGRLATSVTETVLSYSDAHLRQLEKDDLQSILLALKHMLYRIMPWRDADSTLENFSLESALKVHRSTTPALSSPP